MSKPPLCVHEKIDSVYVRVCARVCGVCGNVCQLSRPFALV